MTFHEYYTLNEGRRFRDSSKVTLFANYPMFSVYVPSMDGTSYRSAVALKPEFERAFRDAKTAIQKIGFSSMHTNVLFCPLEQTIVGRAMGNPEHPQGKRSSKYMKISSDYYLSYLHHYKLLEMDEELETMLKDLTKTIVHEWAHLWMFNNGTNFTQAIKDYYEALTQSNIDKLPHPHISKDEKSYFDLFTNQMQTLFRMFVSSKIKPQQAMKEVYTKLQSYMVSVLGKKYSTIEPDFVRDLSRTVYNIIANSNQATEFVTNFHNASIDTKVRNEVNKLAHPVMLKNKINLNELTKLVQWTRSYGLTNHHETWATGIDDFEKLPPYHRQRILQLMQVRGGREMGSRHYSKNMEKIYSQEAGF